MAWIVGIDEAGYGPNLGPFVMTAVACRVPPKRAAADLWNVLKHAARRHSEPTDHRIVVADSKQVYSPARGLVALELAVHASLDRPAATLADLLERLCPECRSDIGREVWYLGTTLLPCQADAHACSSAGEMLADHCRDGGVEWGPISSVVVCPSAFNAMLEKWGTKGAVLTASLVRLLRALPQGDESVSVTIDKHGGRDYYSAMLQPAFEDGLVLAQEEGSKRSAYRVTEGERQVDLAFEPRADGNHFCVALASMVSKYLRELLMLEFNRFWQTKIPGLKATAGYPMDAKRFWADIQPTACELGIEDHVLWRRK